VPPSIESGQHPELEPYSMIDGKTVIFVEAGLSLALPVMLGVVTAAYRRFLAQHSEISDEFTFEQFKSMVRWDMYFALLGILCYVGIGLCTIALIGYYGWLGCLNVPIVYLLIMALGQLSKKTTRLLADLRSLPVKDQVMAAQYAAVIETWKHKPLPNF
jgi:hypothetical protein